MTLVTSKLIHNMVYDNDNDDDDDDDDYVKTLGNISVEMLTAIRDI